MSFRDLTTQDLEAMLADAAPGPWRFKFGGYVIGQDGEFIFNWRDTSQKNAALLALAPEAVAELIAEKDENERLRRELEELQRLLNVRAGILQADRQYVAATGSREAATRITRILEGTNE